MTVVFYFRRRKSKSEFLNVYHDPWSYAANTVENCTYKCKLLFLKALENKAKLYCYTLDESTKNMLSLGKLNI